MKETIPCHTRNNQLPSHINQWLQEIIHQNIGDVFPAITLVVNHNGNCVLRAGWGWIDPETKSNPVTPDTLFDLASISKLFTASAMLSLISDGKIDLCARLSEVIPEFAERNPRPVDGGQDPHTKAYLPTPQDRIGHTVDPNQVTFRQLLTHSSGLAAWRAVFEAAGPPPVPPDQDDPIPRYARWRKALQALCAHPFIAQPGSEIMYSDLGILLLGEAVSRLHGSPGELEIAIRERVTAPLDLRSVVYNPLRKGYAQDQIAPTENDPDWRKRRCWGEVHDENACGVGGVAGHAGLFATANDIAQFGQAWLDNDPRLGIEPQIMRQAKQEQIGNPVSRHGLGWMLKSTAGSSSGDYFNGNAYGHTGFTGTSLWIDPQRKLVAGCLTNRVYPGRHKPGIHAFRCDIHNLLAHYVDQL